VNGGAAAPPCPTVARTTLFNRLRNSLHGKQQSGALTRRLLRAGDSGSAAGRRASRCAAAPMQAERRRTRCETRHPGLVVRGGGRTYPWSQRMTRVAVSQSDSTTASGIDECVPLAGQRPLSGVATAWLGSPRLHAATTIAPSEATPCFMITSIPTSPTTTPGLVWPRWSRRSPGRRLTEGRSVLSAVASASTPGGAGDEATFSHTCVSCAERRVISRPGGAGVQQKYPAARPGARGAMAEDARMPRPRYRSEAEGLAPTCRCGAPAVGWKQQGARACAARRRRVKAPRCGGV
jgi:hypothetical protein